MTTHNTQDTRTEDKREMLEMNAMIEIRHNNDSRKRVIRTINARTFAFGDGFTMIRIDDVITLKPGQSKQWQMVMEIEQLRDILEQLGYTLMKSEDVGEIIQQYNENADLQRSPKCGYEDTNTTEY